MSEPIEFFFDFSSPYGYIAGECIDEIAARYDRTVRWQPILLGVIFKTSGAAPLPSLPLKGAYALRDFVRSARFHGVSYQHPVRFPVSGIAPTRAFHAVASADAATATTLARTLMRAYFVQGIDISDPEATIAVAAGAGLGLEADTLRQAMASQAIKDRVRAATDAAIGRGIFGSPFTLVDGEPFWGADRLDQIERWLATGGW